jgi:hypothetical protein
VVVGCGGGNYCPSSSILRQQMAVFLLRAEHGAAYAPPVNGGQVFADVPASNGFKAFIEQLSAEGITNGCGGGNYCPASPVTRAQMAVFLLRTKEGSGFAPVPPVTPTFADVPSDNPFYAFIEELVARSITVGCGGGSYCPSASVTRGQMAVFLKRTFALP